MPSKSYLDFLALLEDVNQLRETHFNYSKGQRGRKKLGFLTRSAIVMLCAAWERYNENLLLESIDLILNTNIQANALSKHIKEYLSLKVKENKNKIYPIELADDGWRNLWKGMATNDTDLLNTPNSDNLNKLFKRYLGIYDFTNFWKQNSIIKINDFIKIRGDIAHNGTKAKYVRFQMLLKQIDLIISNVIEIDSNISKYLESEYSIKNSWELHYFRTIKSYKNK